MREYPKTDNLYKRNPEKKSELLVGKYTRPEFSDLAEENVVHTEQLTDLNGGLLKSDRGDLPASHHGDHFGLGLLGRWDREGSRQFLNKVPLHRSGHLACPIGTVRRVSEFQYRETGFGRCVCLLGIGWRHPMSLCK